MPLVKVGILSGVDNRDPSDWVYYIDGFNNPGFSGGPIVYSDGKGWHVFAVIKGYQTESIKTEVRGADVDTGLLANSGILLAYPASEALKTIDAAHSK